MPRLLDSGSWLETGCEDSLGVDSRVALLGARVVLLGEGVSLLVSGIALEGDTDEEGALLELGRCDGGALEDTAVADVVPTT